MSQTEVTAKFQKAASHVPWFVPEPLWECGSFASTSYLDAMRTGGTLVSWQGSIPDQKLIELERRWDTLSVIGLACVIIGILLQGAGV